MSAHPANPEPDQNHGFLGNIADIRRRARRHIQQRAASADHSSNREAVLRLLNAALATELACVLRYQRYAVMDREALADAVRIEFVRRAQEEQSHADQIAARIVELGGQPNPALPSASDRADGADDEDESLADMLAEDLIAERIAIDTYREITRFVGEHDATTRGLFESILSVEQGHAEGLASIRESIRRQDRAAAGVAHISQPVEATP
jgi:bacterioferritin